MTKKFAGKVAVVTGASKGIGAAIALQLAEEGATVVVNYSSDKEGAARVVTTIKENGGKALAVQANLTKQADIHHLFNEAKKAFGPLDILVNNAGIYELLPLEEVTEEHFHKQFNLNVLGLILATREAMQHFHGNGGSIINISSLAATLTPPNSVVYSATKAAVNAITKTLAKELAPRKIRVNCINPGMIETEGLVTSGLDSGEMRNWIETITPLARIGTVTDIAPVVSFLASKDASYITGETIYVAGGLG